MVNDLSAISKGSTGTVQSINVAQENTLRTLGLECLVTIMKSMVEWSKELVKPDEETKKNTAGKYLSNTWKSLIVPT